jgi:hypothetical protein
MSEIRYFLYYQRPVKLISKKEEDDIFYLNDMDNTIVLILDDNTGTLVSPDYETCYEILYPRPHHEIYEKSEEDFIQKVEMWRAQFIHGQGAVFASYALMNKIEMDAGNEKRGLSIEEQQFLRNLRIQTYYQFDDPQYNQSLSIGDESQNR